MTQRRFYIHNDQIKAGQAEIAGSEAHHMATVLRLLPGDKVTLITSTSTVWEARIVAISPQKVRLELTQNIPGAVPATSIIVAQALLKARKMDLLVRQLTELGIAGFVPFFSSRSIPTPHPSKMKARQERWSVFPEKRPNSAAPPGCPRFTRPSIFKH